jgi:LysM repeat protein
VISGDTCGSIAQRYSIPLSEFMRYNQLSERSCLTIQIGDILLAPPPTATPGPTETPPPDYTPPPPQATLPADFVYEVKRGDSCSTIAQALGISVDDIIRENSSLNQQCLIVEGQKLNIRRPGAANTVTYAVTPAALLAPTRRTSYEAPGLLSPVDNSVVTDPVITLEWLSVGILRSNEWYVVQIQPSGALTVPVFETKSTSIRLTANLLGGEPERTFAWWVQVRQKAGEMSDGAPIYNDVGPASGVRRFTWQRPIPTSTPPPTP